MRDFRQRAWDPPGSRLEVLLPVGLLVRELAADYEDAIRDWWQNRPGSSGPIDDALDFVGHSLHLTLATTDRPSRTLGPGALNTLVDALRDRLDGVRRPQITVGPAWARRYAIELYVQPSDELDMLADRARAAVRVALGIEPSRAILRPHIALAYSWADLDSDELNATLAWTRIGNDPAKGLVRPVSIEVDCIFCAEVEAWHLDGCSWRNATTVVLAPWNRHNEPEQDRTWPAASAIGAHRNALMLAATTLGIDSCAMSRLRKSSARAVRWPCFLLEIAWVPDRFLLPDRGESAAQGGPRRSTRPSGVSRVTAGFP